MQNLTISTIQADIEWEDKEENLEILGTLIKSIRKRSHVIVLPETFNAGFSQNIAAVAEKEGGITMQWMADWAKKKKAAVVGSLIIKERTKYYNRLIWMNPDGTYHKYDKRHLFNFNNEEKGITAGKERVVIEFRDWRICLQICYDLRFPVWSRNTDNYDILLNVANWPAARNVVWKTLLMARAIENQCYAVGVNRIGMDGNNIDYSGDTMVVDPTGKHILATWDYKEAVEHVSLSHKNLLKIREKFPVINDADRFKLYKS